MMQTEHYGTIITDLGNDKYQLSCQPTFYFMFEILGVLAVGETTEWGEYIAYCGTQDQSFFLSVPFSAKVLRINQALVDYAMEYRGQDFNKNGGFSQTDWVVEIQKIDSKENENTHYHRYRTEPHKEIWHRTTTSHLEIEMGFELRNLCTQEMYFKNFQLLGTNFKENEPIASFEYCPKYLSLAYQNKNTIPQTLEKHKKLAYLYAPCDTDKIDLTFDMYEAIYRANDWLLWHCKREPMLKIKRSFYAYKDINYLFWYQIEGEYIRIGLYTGGYEYIENHGYIPCEFPVVGKVLYKDEFFFHFVVNGPYDPEAYTPFDMEIVSQNPKNEMYELIAKTGEENDFFHRNSFNKEVFFEESWLFIVKPLQPKEVKIYLDKLLAGGSFI